MRFRFALLLASCFAAHTALAQEINIGISATLTGPNAANGVPYRNAEEIYPKTLGGVAVHYTVLDDGTDATTAAKNARSVRRQTRWTRSWARPPRRPPRR